MSVSHFFMQPDFEAPEIKKDEMLFMPLQILFKNSENLLDIVEVLKSDDLVLFEAPVKEAEIGTLIPEKVKEVTFTPGCEPMNTVFPSSSLLRSEGLTTIASRSSVEDMLDNSFSSVITMETEDENIVHLKSKGNKAAEQVKILPIPDYPCCSTDELNALR